VADQAEVLQERVQKGFMVEKKEDMNEEYLNALIQTLIIVGDTELLSVPPLLTAYHDAPTLSKKIVAISIMQDEIGHTHIAHRLLEDLGEDTEEIMKREPNRFKNPYAFDFPLDNWVEFGVFNAFFDRAGYVLLGDSHENTSYGPWKRALAKVDKEEEFHLRHGETVMREAMKYPETREKLEEAVDWMFLMAMEFFGVADEMKSRSAQLDYRIKGNSNDTLRQQFLDSAGEFCDSIGVEIPAHYDENQDRYVLDVPFPCKFDSENKKWLYDEPDTWENVIERFKERGPRNEEFVARIQKGTRELESLRNGHVSNGHSSNGHDE